MKHLAILLGLLCMWNTSTLLAQSADEAAIKEVLQKELEAISQRNLDTWKTLWYQDESSSLVSIHDDWDLRGWDAVLEQVKAFFENSPEPSSLKSTQDKYMINVQGDHAYVHYEETAVGTETVGGEVPMTKYYTSHHMIKVDGKWKNNNVFSTRTLQDLNQSNIITRLVESSMMLARMDRTEDAVKIAEMVAEIYPNHPVGHWGMGYFASERKDKANALKHLEKAASLFEHGAPDNLLGLIESVKKME